MTCKDCLHYEACKEKFAGLCKIRVEEPKKHLELDPNVEKRCLHFTDNSKWVHLPCKLGDTVYQLDNIVDFDFCNGCESYFEGGMGDRPRCEKTVHGFRHCKCIKIIERVANKDFIWCFFKDFGKTVFLTREEAEEALKE